MSTCTRYVYTHICIADMRTKEVSKCTATSERSIFKKLKLQLSMAFQPSADSFGIRLLGVKCSRWHSWQANDTIASERITFSKNQDYKSFSRVTVNPYVPIFWGLDARGGRKLQTDRQTHTHTHTGQLQ